MKVTTSHYTMLWNEYKKMGIEEEFRRVVRVAGAEKLTALEPKPQLEVFLFLSDFIFGIKHGQAYIN